MIFSVLVSIWIGSQYYKLAKKNNKNVLIYMVLGVVCYFATVELGVVLLNLFFTLVLNTDALSAYWLVAILSIAIGMIAQDRLYKYFNTKWSIDVDESDVLDDID